MQRPWAVAAARRGRGTYVAPHVEAVAKPPDSSGVGVARNAVGVAVLSVVDCYSKRINGSPRYNTFGEPPVGGGHTRVAHADRVARLFDLVMMNDRIFPYLLHLVINERSPN